MRLLSRPGLPLVFLLLAVLAHAGLGVLASCPPAGSDRSAAVAFAVVAQPVTGVPDPCTSDAPCQHGTTLDHGDETAARSHDASRPIAPAIVSSALTPSAPQPLSMAVACAVPPVAALAPVAVLCVDRN